LKKSATMEAAGFENGGGEGITSFDVIFGGK
jgi:hypothetical protein